MQFSYFEMRQSLVMNKKLFSIIICTHNRAEILNQSLEKYQKINDLETIEIIVIPNGCTDNTISIIQKHQRFLANLKYYEINEAGHSNSRNVGYQKANSDFVFYIDDDAYPNYDIVNAIKPVIEKGYSIFTGSIRYWRFDTDKKWIKESYIEYILPYDEISKLSNYEYIHGCACGFKKNLLETINFNSNYGMHASKIGYYDEIFLQQQAKKVNIDSYFVPNLIVYHRSHFNSIKGFLKSHFNKGKYYSKYHKPKRIKKIIGFITFFCVDFITCITNLGNTKPQQFLIEWLDRPMNYLGQAMR